MDDTAAQSPNRALQPAEQWALSSPQKLYSLQQFPKALPWQVAPLVLHAPSWEIGSPAGAVEDGTGDATEAAIQSPKPVWHPEVTKQ
jgi:hypothetical protein